MDSYFEKDGRSVLVKSGAKIFVEYNDGAKVYGFSASCIDSLIGQNLSNEKFSEVIDFMKNCSPAAELVNRHYEFVENGKKGNFRFLIDALIPKRQ